MALCILDSGGCHPARDRTTSSIVQSAILSSKLGSERSDLGSVRSSTDAERLRGLKQSGGALVLPGRERLSRISVLSPSSSWTSANVWRARVMET